MPCASEFVLFRRWVTHLRHERFRDFTCFSDFHELLNFPPISNADGSSQQRSPAVPWNYYGTEARYAWNMAAMRTLTVAGLFLAFCALGLIAVAIGTDNWYETDARRHRERCKNYSNKRNDPGYIYISNNNLPLRMLPKERNVETRSGEMLLRAKRHFLPPAPAMESLCSRQFNSTITGLWKKCHRGGFDLEMEDRSVPCLQACQSTGLPRDHSPSNPILSLPLSSASPPRQRQEEAAGRKI